MRLENKFVGRACGYWPRITGFAAGTILVVAWAAVPRAAGQTVGPITPDPSRATQQTPTQTAPPPPAAIAKTNLAGAWRLDKDDSDDPREKMREAMGNSGGLGRGQGGGGGMGRGGGWGMGGPGMGGGPLGGGQGGGGWGGNRGGGNAEPPEGAMDTSDLSQLTIEQSDAAAKVTGATGRILAVYSSSNPEASNKPPKGKRSDDDTYTPPAAQLQNGQLVVVTQGRRNEKTTRTYALSPDRTQLYVSTKLENPRFSQPVVIRFVYDQAKTASGN